MPSQPRPPSYRRALHDYERYVSDWLANQLTENPIERPPTALRCGHPPEIIVVAQAAALERAVRTMLAVAVEDARVAEVSWTALSRAIGTSRQAATKRFRDRLDPEIVREMR